MTILLVRHAESEANVNWKILRETTDFRLALTPKGHQQSRDLGVFLNDFFKANPPKNKIRLWSSPYRRTVQTGLGLLETAKNLPWEENPNGGVFFFDDMLREREYGLLEGMEESERTEKFPHQAAHYKKLVDHEQKYYARPYGGESPADVSARLRHFYMALTRSIDEGHADHVIIAHGNVNACFTIGFTGAHPAFYNELVTGSNTSVMLFDKNEKTDGYADYGLIYDPEKNLSMLRKPEVPILRNITGKLESL